MILKRSVGVILACGVVAAFAQQPKNVEALHFWTSGGEAAALGVLKKDLENQGIQWNDMPVAGGGGEQAMTALRSRVTSGNPPTAALLMGFDLSDWARQGVLADLDAVAQKEQWDRWVPKAVQRFTKHEGKWIAAPLAVHSINWVWANKTVLEKSGVKGEPRNWDEFVAAAEKVKKAGFTAIAHGGQPWQDATLFDGVALATGGPSFYKKAFVDLDAKTLGSPTMTQVFKRMTQLRQLMDKDFSGRDWNVASSMVISGKAGFQIMGDWAKGEFSNAKLQPEKDYLCFPIPGTQGSVSFLSNQFAMFKSGGAAQASGVQVAMASASLKPEVQSAFNVLKGSVPARSDVPNTAFDQCGRRAMSELATASQKEALVGSMAHGHASPTAVKNAFYDVITRHLNGQIDDAKAVAEMVMAARS